MGAQSLTGEYRALLTMPIIERLWSIAAPLPQHEMVDGGRSTVTSQLRVGNTRTAVPAIPQKEKDGPVMYSLDNLSGRFIKHALGSISDEVNTTKVVLYTLKGDA